MLLKILETLIIYFFMYTLAFDDIFVDGSSSHDMIEKGRTQYQLLREKSSLPHYGSCWKSALDHVEDGCRNLSEETQSDMALHLTNCFLEQSGHETYNCEFDKKPNLRGICIRSMSDRAFNVYTEFYTHVQNICWFLRGQVWYETISESSFKVGKQLELSAKNQEILLETQKESIQVQEKILKHEKMLEEVLGNLYVSMDVHREILTILTKTISNFQTFVIGEISWFDTILFYFSLSCFIFFITSVKRTSNARLPLLCIFLINFIIERFICYIFINEDSLFNSYILYENIYSYVWYFRNFFLCISFFYFFYHLYNYRDINVENNKLLEKITNQNVNILEKLSHVTNCLKEKSPNSDRFNLINESLHCNGFLRKSNDLDDSSSGYSERIIRGRKTYSKNLIETHCKYNLRSSKQSTPDLS